MAESTTTVVCVKVGSIRPKYHTLKEWMDNPNHVYIGRGGIVFIDGARFPKKGSLFANPFKAANADGTDPFEPYLRKRLRDDLAFREEFCQLKGKVLGCWCKPKQCHGDTIARILDTEF